MLRFQFLPFKIFSCPECRSSQHVGANIINLKFGGDRPLGNAEIKKLIDVSSSFWIKKRF